MISSPQLPYCVLHRVTTIILQVSRTVSIGLQVLFMFSSFTLLRRTNLPSRIFPISRIIGESCRTGCSKLPSHP